MTGSARRGGGRSRNPPDAGGRRSANSRAVATASSVRGGYLPSGGSIICEVRRCTDAVNHPLRVVVARCGVVGVDFAADGGAENPVTEQRVRAGSVDLERALLQESDLLVGEELAVGIGLGTLYRSKRVVFPIPPGNPDGHRWCAALRNRLVRPKLPTAPTRQAKRRKSQKFDS